MQVSPNYTQMHPRERIEALLGGHTFFGPGLYLRDDETILVIPVPPDAVISPKTVWDKEQVHETVYAIHYYNVPFHRTIFSVIANAPTRSDKRRPR